MHVKQISSTRQLAIRASMALAVGSMAMAAQAGTAYDSTPAVLPASLPSQPYQAQQTVEFGDHVGLAGTDRQLQSVTITMVTWAYQSPYLADPLYQNAAGWTHNLTANIYGVDNSGANPALGSLLTTKTDAKLIPWRAEPSGACSDGQWLSAEGCRNGYAFNVTFDFSALNVTLPNELIFGLAMNTQSYGSSPLGVNGPYNSLNFGLTGANSVGTDVETDAVFWNTGYQPFLSTGVAGQFGRDTVWSGYVPAIQINVVPEPEAYGLALAGIGVVGFAIRRRRKVA